VASFFLFGQTISTRRYHRAVPQFAKFAPAGNVVSPCARLSRRRRAATITLRCRVSQDEPLLVPSQDEVSSIDFGRFSLSLSLSSAAGGKIVVVVEEDVVWVKYVVHELLADGADVVVERSREHHHLLVVGSQTEDLLDISAHV
jgi:hypothetical protein